MATALEQPKTLVINNWNGRGTRKRDGDINSGMSPVSSYVDVPYGFDAQQLAGVLLFSQVATSIKGSVITDCVMAGKVRVESGVTYLYCIGHLKRLYKIQVNNPSSSTPDYDNPVLVATLANSQTFQFGGSLDFYQGGGTEKIWIGHDTGMTKINFDGTGETNLAGGSWIPNVPRLQVQFVGKIYITNGSNLAEIDSTEAVISYTKISPGFPVNSLARDIRLSADGRYLVVVVTRATIGNLLSTDFDANLISSTNSFLFYWNGTDLAASSSTTLPAFPMSSYFTFGNNEYLFGTQVGGAMLGGPTGNVVEILEFETTPTPNAIAASGDYVGWWATRYVNGVSKAVLNLYGTIGPEVPVGIYKQLVLSSTLTGGDVIRCPFGTSVTSWQPTGATGGYSNTPFKLMGTGKSYFSTIEYDGSTTSYNFYAFHNVIDFQTSANTGNYLTQTQIFKKKVKVTEVRVYMEPATVAAVTSFSTDLIGIAGTAITGGSYTFTSSNQISTTNDILKYNPSMAPTAALGFRINNLGVLTPFIHKVEIDYTSGGD